MEHECPAIEHSLQEDGHVLYAYIFIEESRIIDRAKPETHKSAHMKTQASFPPFLLSERGNLP